MKERGMIFNGEMVRAILDGRKMQTRRPMKPQPSNVIHELFIWKDNATPLDELVELCPHGKPGDRIWVRETYQGPLLGYEQIDAYLEDCSKFEKPEFCKYAADGGPTPEFYDADDNLRYGWRPSIHMPRWASRILLEITSVRVERLNNISDSDALAEGVQGSQISPAKYVFGSLWQSIYGPDNPQSWQANPWVWVIEFKCVEASDAN